MFLILQVTQYFTRSGLSIRMTSSGTQRWYGSIKGQRNFEESMQNLQSALHLLPAGHRSMQGNLGPLLLTWFNFNPSMDKLSYPLQRVGCNYISIPKLHRLHLLISNFIPHFTEHVNTYPCRDWSQSMWVKRATAGRMMTGLGSHIGPAIKQE